MRHFCPRVQQSVVHVDVYHLRTVFHLLAGNGDGLLILLFLNQAQELARTGHVAPLADVEEIVCRADFHVVQPGKMQMLGVRRGTARRHCFVLSNQVAEGFNKPFVRSAAASDDIDDSGLCHLPDLQRHFLRSLVITTHFIRQSGVRITAHREKAEPCHFIQERSQVVCSERAVQTECEKRIMAHRRVEGL